MSKYQFNESMPDILKLLDDLEVMEHERTRFFSLMSVEAEFYQSMHILARDIYSRFFCEAAKRKLLLKELVDINANALN